MLRSLLKFCRCPDDYLLRSPTLDNSLTTIIQPLGSGVREGEAVPKSPHPHQNLLYSHPNASADQSTRYRTAKSQKGQIHCKAISSDSRTILRAVFLQFVVSTNIGLPCTHTPTVYNFIGCKGCVQVKTVHLFVLQASDVLHDLGCFSALQPANPLKFCPDALMPTCCESLKVFPRCPDERSLFKICPDARR